MYNRIKAAEEFKEMLNSFKVVGPDYIEHVAKAICKSRHTVKQYASSPTSKGHRTPTPDATDALREAVMMRAIYRPAARGGPFMVNLNPGVAGFSNYVVALDYADMRGAEVSMPDGPKTPVLDDDQRLRHQWRKIAFDGIVGVELLAEIAGTDVFCVGWVGREHPKFGIQPTFEMVSRATAAEALTTLSSGRRAA